MITCQIVASTKIAYERQMRISILKITLKYLLPYAVIC